MHRLAFLFLCLAPIVFAEDVEFMPCKNSDDSFYPEVKAVDVSPCPKQPCEIPKGGFVTITVKCVSNINSEKLRLSVYASVAGIELPYPGMKRDACVGKNITCPLKEGDEFTYVQKLPVRKFFPSIDTITRFHLKTIDDSDKDICCFRAPVRVVDAEGAKPEEAKPAKPADATA